MEAEFGNHIGLARIGVVALVYFVTIFIGHWCIAPVMEKLNRDKNPFRKQGTKIEEAYARKQSGILGIIERALYLTAFLAGWIGFIGIWITLKTVVKWKQWNEENGRVFFNNFLIGSGLNLLYSFCGFLMIQYATSPHQFKFFPLNIIVWLLVLSAPYIITCVINCCCLNSLVSPDNSNIMPSGKSEIFQEKTEMVIKSETTKISN
jgi:hypothetical protein